MRGKTLTLLAVENGLCSSLCRVALRKPSYPGEQVIARFLDVPAKELWPERYDETGAPRHPRLRRRHLRSRILPLRPDSSGGRR